MLSEKVCIFIDGSNMWWGLRGYNQRNNTNIRIDYKKLENFLLKGRPLLRTYYYCSRPERPDPRQLALLESLRNRGITVVEKTLRTRTDPVTGATRTVEKGVDATLVTHLLGLAWEGAYETAILVSGDEDFVEAVQKVKDKGKRIEIATFKGRLSDELRKLSDSPIVFIDDIVELVKIGKKS